MFKKQINNVKDFIIEEIKFIILLIVIYIICTFPVNYYIVVGGGISDIDSRLSVEEQSESKGSFNISYVTEIEGRLGPYLLSFIIPDWKRISANDYKYDDHESFEDIQFRSDLDLKIANATATMWAYKLANKKFEITDTKIYVTAVLDDFDVGLKVQDEIISIDNIEFKNTVEYQSYIKKLKENDTVLVKVIRNGETKDIKTKVHSYKGSLLLGVGLGVVNDYKTDPKISINFKKGESGPSGGLITTLSIYDKLIEEDVTKSLKIAGTGTIKEDGTIGEIGEVKYKLLGAISDKADVFLVPKGDNYDTCIKLVKDRKLDIKVIGVGTIYEAVDALKEL